MNEAKLMPHVGQVIARQLRALGADTVFCVPGESYLGLLDGLYDERDAIKTITCRHESGAANMADAYAKLTGKPGICAVTRGPGATHAANGVHTAFQDSSPMILFVGQVGRDFREREAFQEMDYKAFFGDTAKWVASIDDPSRVQEFVTRAWRTALSGRPGPVVLVLPEDALTERLAAEPLSLSAMAEPAPTPDAMAGLRKLLAEARQPLMVVGGPGWSAGCAAQAEALATAWSLPVVASFRCQDYFNNDHPHYAGALTVAANPQLRDAVRDDVDLLIVVGSRLGEMTTQGYTLVDIPRPQMRMVHVHPDALELGRVYQPDIGINASARTFLAAAGEVTTPSPPQGRADWVARMRDVYVDSQKPITSVGALNLSEVVLEMDRQLPDDAIVSNGAGNYTVWLHRFYRHRRFRTQLAPTSGSMGYGVPAAVAAKLTHPERTVVSFAGDGCFQMSSQEMATAAQNGAAIIHIIVNNGMLGTIRMHQERRYPERVVATEIVNPDFVALARAYGAEAERVERTADFAPALQRALAAKGSYLIDLVVDPQDLTPTQSLDAARKAGLASQAP